MKDEETKPQGEGTRVGGTEGRRRTGWRLRKRSMGWTGHRIDEEWTGWTMTRRSADQVDGSWTARMLMNQVGGAQSE